MRFSCFVFVCDNILKMAHQLAQSVNCSLDDIDLSALKVSFKSKPKLVAAKTRCLRNSLFSYHTGTLSKGQWSHRAWIICAGSLYESISTFISSITVRSSFQDPAGIFELIEVVGNGTYGQVYKVNSIHYYIVHLQVAIPLIHLSEYKWRTKQVVGTNCLIK